MSIRRISFAAGVLGIALALTLIAFADKEEALEEAEKQYGKHNYKDALQLFRKALEGEVEKRPETERKVLICLAKLGKWDEAIEEAGAYVERHASTIHEAEGFHLRGTFYFERPHYGYRTKQGKFVRGRYVRGGYYVNSEKEDLEKARKDLERAKALCYALEDGAGEDEALRAEVRSFTVELDMDLARMLERISREWSFRHLLDPEKEKEAPEAEGRYDPAWTLRQKTAFLYDEAEDYDASKDRHISAVARYRKAMYFRRVGAVRKSENPLTILDGLLETFPEDSLADDALFASGRVLEEKDSFLEAKERYRRLEEDYAESQWVSDGRFRIRRMEQPRILVDSSGVRLPGTGQTVKVKTRNLPALSFTAFPVDLEKVFSDARNDRSSWRNFFDRFLQEGGAREFWDIQCAEWEFGTEDAGDHRWVEGEMRVPLERAGAYVLQARGKTVVHTSMLVLSDLAVIRKMDGKRMLVFVTDAVTGEAVPGAKLQVREKFWVRTRSGSGYRTHYFEGSTDERGVFERELEPSGNRSKRIQVLARTDRRYAATGLQSWYWRSGGESPHVRVYAYTDRPVYRPGHTVRYKAMFRVKEGGAYETLAGRAVRVRIRNPKRKYVYDETLTTNDFGSVHGELTLGEEPPLGLYSIRVSVPGFKRVSTARGARFRVEEYKKPEFEVKVTTDEPQVKLGSKVRVKINASYYFGGPVAGAEVGYRVFRRAYRHRFVPSGEYDWLYGRGYGWRPWWWYFWGPRRAPAEELVLDGKAKTDAEGNVFVDLETEPFLDVGKDWKEGPPDHLFTVKAEVRDASRRTIEGSGEIKVTRNEFYAFVTSPRGFFEKGERAKFEIVTQNAMGVPVEAAGAVKVVRIVPAADPKAEPERRTVIEEALSTDGNGRAWFRFVPDVEGRFEVRFEAKDSWGGEVVGRREVWSVGEEFEGWRFRFSDVEILTDKRSYEKGETARIMVNTNHRGADVLFSLEAGNEILDYQVLSMSGKSVIVPVELSKRHAPNFFVRAALFAGGKPFMEDREIFVPPADRFLDVTVNPSREAYKPGEKAEIAVKVRDRRGDPVQCEVSLGVIDRSVLYIQPAFAPDVRVYYYGDRRRLSGRPDNSLQHGFRRHEEHSAWYPEIKTHGMPPGWRGYGHWRDFFGEESELHAGVRFDRSRGHGRLGRMRGGSKGAEGAPQGERALEEEEKMDKDAGAPAESRARRRAKAEKPAGRPAGGEEGKGMKEPTVRKNFADTAFWAPTGVTGEDGSMTFRFTFPDSLTSWQATAVAADGGSRVGNAKTAVVTKKNLMVRLAAPRFFTERDEVVLSGIANNYLSTAKEVRFEFSFEGGCLEAVGKTAGTRTVEAGGVERIDVRVKAVKDGEATVLLKALTDEESDAVQKSFPVVVHGIQKAVTVTGVMRGYETNEMKIDLSVPEERDPAASSLEIRVSPSIASCMLDALPYLIEYPYGCAEQTMSRFLPAVTVARTLKDLGVDLEEIGRKRAEIDAAHLAERVKSRWHTLPDPVFDTATLDRIVREGLRRIYTFQKPSGGFGWWAGSDANPYMTAYVAYGLLEAKRAGYGIEEIRLGRALGYLQEAFREDKSLHRRAYIGWVLAGAGVAEEEDLDAIFVRRDDLNHYTKCLLALALHEAGRTEQAKIVVENVLQFASVDEENKTCFLDTGARYWWTWYNDRIEATVFLLRALMAVDGSDRRIPMIVKWLVNNRKGSRWASTKSTANAVYALSEYIRAEDELRPEYTVTVDWPGVGRKAFHVTRSNVFTFDGVFRIEGADIPGGDHEINVTRDGKGSVYLTAHLRYFSKEENIQGAGHELFVDRSFHRMIPQKKKVERGGRTVEVLDWKRVALSPGETVKSGERIEVRLDIEAKNRYEYLVFEDAKPAGLEPVQLRSGFAYGNLCSHMELRDEKVVFFTDALDTGKHVITYQMRAEVPGLFHALPTKAFAMYAPKVGGISDEWTMEITD